MTNLEKYQAVFIKIFQVSVEELSEEFTVKSCKEWDSMNHISMIMALEDAFEIMLDPEDIIEFISYTKGIELLEKYNIQL